MKKSGFPGLFFVHLSKPQTPQAQHAEGTRSSDHPHSVWASAGSATRLVCWCDSFLFLKETQKNRAARQEKMPMDIKQAGFHESPPVVSV